MRVSGGLHAQKGWPGHATPAPPAHTGGHPAATNAGGAASGVWMGGPQPTARPQQELHAGQQWGGQVAPLQPAGAGGHHQAGPAQQHLPGPPDSKQMRQAQMAAADQDFQKQRLRLRGLQQAWLEQVRSSSHQGHADVASDFKHVVSLQQSLKLGGHQRV